jgi:hypothetical protein
MNLLLELELKQIVNLVKLSFKSPKRLIPVLMFFFWIFYFTISQFFINLGHQDYGRYPTPNGYAGIYPSMTGLVDAMLVARIVVFAMVLGITIYFLYKSFSESMIIFAMPDIDFLFAMPINRKLVMGFKLIKVYITTGFVALFLTVTLVQMIRMLEGYPGSSLTSAWFSVLVFSTLLVNTCTLVNLTSSYRPGGKWWVHIAFKWFVILFLVALAAGAIILYKVTGSGISAAVTLFTFAPLKILLAPIRWTTDLVVLPYVKWTNSNFTELGGLALASLVTFALVLLRRENPYEPSLSVSARTAAFRAAWRSGGLSRARAEARRGKGIVRAVRIIPPFGRGAVAIAWKNLEIMLRTSGRAMMIVPVLVVGAIYAVRMVGQVNQDEMGLFVVGGVAYLVLLGAGFTLQSLRGDLKQTDTLKPLPIPAWQLILAETAQGTVILSLLGWLAFGATWALFGLGDRSPVILAAWVLPWVVHAALSSQSAVAVLYPNWEDVSQKYIGGIFSMVANMVSLGPAIGFAWGLYYLRFPVIVIVIVVALLESGISVGGTLLGATAYKRYDPTNA